MSKQIWIRPMKSTPAETKLFAEYLYANRTKNRFDPEIFEQNRAKVFAAYNDEGIKGFVPVRNSYVVESLAMQPDLSPITEAKILQAFQHMIVNKAAENNIHDANFCSFDQTVLDIARNYGWKDVIVPTVNLKFSELGSK